MRKRRRRKKMRTMSRRMRPGYVSMESCGMLGLDDWRGFGIATVRAKTKMTCNIYNYSYVDLRAQGDHMSFFLWILEAITTLIACNFRACATALQIVWQAPSNY
jgi:hypothetical protein